MQDEGEGGFDDEIMDEEDGSEGENDKKGKRKEAKTSKKLRQVKKDENVQMIDEG